MRGPQVINPQRDSMLSINGYYVIDDTTQTEIGLEGGYNPPLSIPVSIAFANLTDSYSSGSTEFLTGVIDMIYLPSTNYWVIKLDENDSTGRTIASYLENGKKYCARVIESGSTYNMRSFNLSEFSVDHEAIYKTTVDLPYQIEKDSSKMYIRWYDNVNNFGDPAHREYEAEAYMNGEGTIPATDPGLITHRGPIKEV